MVEGRSPSLLPWSWWGAHVQATCGVVQIQVNIHIKKGNFTNLNF